MDKAFPIIENCPIGCNEDIADTNIILPEGSLKRCSNCFHLFSQCNEQQYVSSMEEEFNTFEGTWPPPKNMARLKRNTQKILKKAKDILKKENFNSIKLLDIGCSNGAFIFVAGKLGVECEGVDPAKNAVIAANAAGLKVHHGYLEECNLPNNTYDIITLFEVIEHIKEPANLFKECRRLLKDQGLVIIRTANTDSWTVKIFKGEWHYFNIGKHGGHISFFCKDSIETLAKHTGFQIEKYYTHRVSLCHKDSVSYIKYRTLKLLSDMLNLPSKFTGNGEEMEVYLRKS